MLTNISRLCGFTAACLLLAGCASLLTPSGSGNTVTEADGTVREETQADVLVNTGSGILGTVTGNPFIAALAAQVGAGVISMARRKES
jgi:hypothetical protein